MFIYLHLLEKQGGSETDMRQREDFQLLVHFPNVYYKDQGRARLTLGAWISHTVVTDTSTWVIVFFPGGITRKLNWKLPCRMQVSQIQDQPAVPQRQPHNKW